MAAKVCRFSNRMWCIKASLACLSRHNLESQHKIGLPSAVVNNIRSFYSENNPERGRNSRIRWPKGCCPETGSNCRLNFSTLKADNIWNSGIEKYSIHDATPIKPIKRQFTSPSRDFTAKYDTVLKDENFTFYKEKCTNDDNELENFKNSVLTDFILKEDFVSREEENLILNEVQKALKRLRYEYDHWDGVIYGYRELEKSRWTPENKKFIKRIEKEVFDKETLLLPGVHVLDLSSDGYIKPHVDSKFCGRRIAGVSLLSTAVMRLKPNNCESYSMFVDVLLKPRSLYIMRDFVRYELTHEILPDEISYFGETRINRDRRIAVIMREEPTN